jgi:hypothetical protein
VLVGIGVRLRSVTNCAQSWLTVRRHDLVSWTTHDLLSLDWDRWVEYRGAHEVMNGAVAQVLMAMPEPSICQAVTAQATAATPNTIATVMPSAASSTPRTAGGTPVRPTPQAGQKPRRRAGLAKRSARRS